MNLCEPWRHRGPLMGITAALYLTALSLASPADGAPAPLRLDAGLTAPSLGGLTLRSEAFGFDGDSLLRARSLAQTAQTQTAATAAQPAGEAAGTSAASGCEASCDIDCDTCRDADRAARYVMRRRARNLRTHRYFAYAAWGSLLVTEVLGTIQFVNQPTAFGDGNCTSDPTGFGCGDSAGVISGLHHAFAFITTGLYTTSGIIAATAPDPDNASVGTDLAARTLRAHKFLAWVHAGGMILLPILGILTTNPQLFGMDTPEERRDFARGMRTAHGMVGYATFAALTTAGILEF